MWLLDNFKPFGRMQRAEYFMRSVLLLLQFAFWCINMFVSGIGAAMSARAGHHHMRMTLIVALFLGLLIAYQGFVLMLRRLQDIGLNPVLFISGYGLFWLAEYMYFSTIPDLVVTVEDYPLPISWLGVSVPLILGMALFALPSGPEGVSRTARDGAEGGSSWADAIKIPTAAAAATPASSATGERRRAPRANVNTKPQFGNRPARER